MTERPAFRDACAALEHVVRQLEDDDLDLDEAIALFEEGVKHLRSARDLLAKSELTVKRVLEEADGSVRTAPLD